MRGFLPFYCKRPLNLSFSPGEKGPGCGGTLELDLLGRAKAEQHLP